jgi:hypothetical protein
MSRKWCPGRDLNPHSPCGEKDFKTLPGLRSGTNPLHFQALSELQARRTYREYRSRTAHLLHTRFFALLDRRSRNNHQCFGLGSRIDHRAICLADRHVDSGAVGSTTPKPVAKSLSKPLPIVGVHLHQLEVFDALKVRSVPGEQRHIMRQSNPSDQTVAHSYLSACTFKFAPNVSRVFGGSTVQRQHADRFKQLTHRVTALVFTGTTQKLEAAHSSCLELVRRNIFRNLIGCWLDAGKEINQDISIGDNHRQLSRSSFVSRSNSSRSFFEIEPASESSVLRRFSRSASPCKKLSMASPSTAENPLCPRRDAKASRALRCSGFISTVVRISRLYMHMHAHRQIRALSDFPDHTSRI